MPVFINARFIFPREGELFIRRTFVRKCKVKYEITWERAETAFDELLGKDALVFVRNVGMPPGMPAYGIGPVDFLLKSFKEKK